MNIASYSVKWIRSLGGDHDKEIHCRKEYAIKTLALLTDGMTYLKKTNKKTQVALSNRPVATWI